LLQGFLWSYAWEERRRAIKCKYVMFSY
jgi:hypothetical protein